MEVRRELASIRFWQLDRMGPDPDPAKKIRVGFDDRRLEWYHDLSEFSIVRPLFAEAVDSRVLQSELMASAFYDCIAVLRFSILAIGAEQQSYLMTLNGSDSLAELFNC
jgi:hypothetical protein